MTNPMMIETSDFTVAILTEKTYLGNPVYSDDCNYWVVNSDGMIELMGTNNNFDK